MTKYYIGAIPLEVFEQRMKDIEPCMPYLTDLYETIKGGKYSSRIIEEIVYEMMNTGQKASVIVSEQG